MVGVINNGCNMKFSKWKSKNDEYEGTLIDLLFSLYVVSLHWWYNQINTHHTTSHVDGVSLNSSIFKHATYPYYKVNNTSYHGNNYFKGKKKHIITSSASTYILNTSSTRQLIHL